MDHLQLQEMEFDQKTCQVYLSKLSNPSAAVRHQQTDWENRVHRVNTTAAITFHERAEQQVMEAGILYM